MKVCLIVPAPDGASAPDQSRLLAASLAPRHEVTLIQIGDGGDLAGPPAAGFRTFQATIGEELASQHFACEEHRRSAATMAALRRAYAGGRGPDYLEVPDRGAAGLVPLQARRAVDPLLAETTIAVRVSPGGELLDLYDGNLRQGLERRPARLEREQLRLADHLLWPGGACLDLYRRHYRELELPQPVRLRAPFWIPPAQPGPAPRPEGPLRLLFAGDLSRAAGVLDLVEACRLLPPESWTLTLTGRDTETATMGQSVRQTIEAMSGDDPRIEFAEEEMAGAALTARLARADLLVAPDRLGCSAVTAIAALGAGVPVLATPVGDLVEVVEDAVSGWHAEGTGSLALGRALCRLEADRDEIARVRSSGGPRRRAEELTDPRRILDAYEEFLGGRRCWVPARAAAKEPPLVTGIVPYYRAAGFVAEAVASLLGQTYPRVEVLVVNDGSFEPADSILEELGADPRVRVVTQLNRGESTARNLGARVAAGEYLVMLDADNVLEPRFVERALETLQADPELVYGTCWLRMIGPDGRETSVQPDTAPLGNAALDDYEENWDGDTLAMLPRRVFTELGFEFHPEGSMHSDWQLYRAMRRRGAYGAVIPEKLARYRVLEESIIHSYPRQLQERSWRESAAQEELEALGRVPEGAG